MESMRTKTGAIVAVDPEGKIIVIEEGTGSGDYRRSDQTEGKRPRGADFESVIRAEE